MAKSGPKPLVDERRFQPRSLDEAEQLYYALVANGVPVSRARGIVTWLIVLPEQRAEDPASNALRRDYRRALLGLGEPPWEATSAMVGYIGSAGPRHQRRLSLRGGRRPRWVNRTAA